MTRKLVITAMVCALAGAVWAASPEDFTLQLEKVNDTTVLLVGSWTASNIQGWSWGVCHPEGSVSICTMAGMATNCDQLCPEVTCTQDLLTVNNGQPAAFNNMSVYAGGMTQGVVIDFMTIVTLPARERFEFMQIQYTLHGVESAEINFCNTLGGPPVDTVFVVGGASIAPATMVGTTIGGDIPQCDLTMSLARRAQAAEESDKLAVLLTTCAGEEPSAFSFGIADDSAEVTPIDVAQGAAITAAGGADFWSPSLNATGGALSGLTLGAVIDMAGAGGVWRVLPANTANQEIAVVSYTSSGANTVQTQTSLVSTLSRPDSPVTPVVVDFDGTSVTPAIGAPVAITVVPSEMGVPFVRGDANQDGTLNVSDAVAIVKYAFEMGSKKPLIDKCQQSADVNDDGTITTADAIYLLNYLFIGGPVIPPPHGVCGQGRPDDPLTCEEFAC